MIDCVPKVLPSLTQTQKNSGLLNTKQKLNEKIDELYKENIKEFKTKNQKSLADHKSIENSKIKNSLNEHFQSLLDFQRKTQILEQKIADKKSESNSLAGTEKEILCKIFDCNLELESMSSIDIFQTSEQISQKNSSFLAILANTKQLKSKHANLRNFLIKISVEYSEKEKKLKELKSVLINIKESSGSTYSKSVYEIAELEKSAKVLKEQLNYKKNP